MAKLSKEVRADICEALTSGNGKVFKPITCPLCGEDKAQIELEKLSKDDTSTAGGGFIIRAKFACGDPEVAWVFADDEEGASLGRVAMPPKEFVLPLS